MTDSAANQAAIDCNQFLAHPPARVWEALVRPDLLARWWAPGDIRAEAGHRFEMGMGPWGRQACTVQAVEPERLLCFSFGDGGLDTTVTFRLVPEGSGTRLVLRHEGFDPEDPIGRRARDGMGQGWPTVLARLGAALTPAP